MKIKESLMWRMSLFDTKDAASRHHAKDDDAVIFEYARAKIGLVAAAGDAALFAETKKRAIGAMGGGTTSRKGALAAWNFALKAIEAGTEFRDEYRREDYIDVITMNIISPRRHSSRHDH